MSRQTLYLNDERKNSYVIQLKMMFNTLMRKKLLLKIELHANNIKQHHLSLIACGGNAEFEVDDFFKQQFSDLHNNDDFRKRKGKQQAQYNKEFYEMKFFRSNTVSYSVQNIAKGMAKYVYASFLKEKTQPLLEDAVDLTKKSVVVGTAVVGGSQAVAAYQALSIPTRVLIGKATLGGSQGAFGAWATGGDKIDVVGGTIIGTGLGAINIARLIPFRLSEVSSSAISSAIGNSFGQFLTIIRNPEKNNFNITSLAFSTWGGGYSSYITKEIDVQITKTVLETLIQTPIDGIGSKL